MPRVLALRAAAARAANADAATTSSSSPQTEWVEWVEWPDEPRHEHLFDIPDPSSGTVIARAYAAVFPSSSDATGADAGESGDRWTLYHRHREDTAYVCASAAADDPSEAEVWNEELVELPEAWDGGEGGGERPTHRLLPPARVFHSTGLCFCNPHATRDKGRYIHRLRYAAANPRTLHFVGVEVKRRRDRGDGDGDPAPPPLPSAPEALSLTLEHEQPGLFRAWRLLPSAAASEAAASPLGGGFARRGGAVVLIKPADWSKLEISGGGGEGGPFGAATRERAHGAGGWKAAGGDSFPAGAAWPLRPEDGQAPFAVVGKSDETVLEAMLVEFL
jgi:hypothetical protein